jgi:hypothetical protein
LGRKGGKGKRGWKGRRGRRGGKGRRGWRGWRGWKGGKGRKGRKGIGEILANRDVRRRKLDPSRGASPVGSCRIRGTGRAFITMG